MSLHDVINLVFNGIGIAGGLALVFGAVQGRRTSKPWVTLSLSISGACAMLWGGLGVFLVLNNAKLGYTTYLILRQYKAGVGGVVIGVLVVLFLSRELRGEMKVND